VPTSGEDETFESATVINLELGRSRSSTTTRALRLDEKNVASGWYLVRGFAVRNRPTTEGDARSSSWIFAVTRRDSSRGTTAR
jgi:hypothetical protein